MKYFPKKALTILDKIVTASLFLFVAFSMFSISITQIAAGIGGIAWLLRTHIAKNWQEQRWPLGVPFLLFALTCLVAVVDAFDVSYSFKPLKKLLEVLIFFWVVNCVRDKSLHTSLSTLLIISATLASLYIEFEDLTLAEKTAEAGLKQDPENEALMISRTPIGRLGNTEDVSNAVEFLMSEKSSFITGQNIIVDGGWLSSAWFGKYKSKK